MRVKRLQLRAHLRVVPHVDARVVHGHVVADLHADLEALDKLVARRRAGRFGRHTTRGAALGLPRAAHGAAAPGRCCGRGLEALRLRHEDLAYHKACLSLQPHARRQAG